MRYLSLVVLILAVSAVAAAPTVVVNGKQATVSVVDVEGKVYINSAAGGGQRSAMAPQRTLPGQNTEVCTCLTTVMLHCISASWFMTYACMSPNAPPKPAAPPIRTSSARWFGVP